MQLIVMPTESSHWYHADGTPAHQIEMKTKPGQYRNATVKDARELGLLPSVTNILGILRKPQLEDWKLEQAILASVTLKHIPGETTDDFVERVKDDYRAESGNAMELGTSVHLSLENFEVNQIIPDTTPHRESVLAWAKWRKENISSVIGTEIRFGQSEIGYGGCCDFVGKNHDGKTYVIDFKTQGHTVGKKKMAATTSVALVVRQSATLDQRLSPHETQIQAKRRVGESRAARGPCVVQTPHLCILGIPQQ